MSRINVGIPPQNLIDQHLLAEHREIKRVTNFYSKRLEKSKFDDIPARFSLGKGHVTFFLDKGLYTFERYCMLHQECKNRGFDVKYYGDNWNEYKENRQHFNDYDVKGFDVELIKERIKKRITESNMTPRYESRDLSKDEAIELLNDNLKG